MIARQIESASADGRSRWKSSKTLGDTPTMNPPTAAGTPCPGRRSLKRRYSSGGFIGNRVLFEGRLGGRGSAASVELSYRRIACNLTVGSRPRYFSGTATGL